MSLIIGGDEENNSAAFFPSELHENKPQKNHKYLSHFLTYQGLLLQNPLRSKEEWILAIHEACEAFEIKRSLFEWLILFQPEM